MPNDDWSVMIEEKVYETDLTSLLQWIAEGRVKENHLVKRGALNWVEARLAPQLRQIFPLVSEPPGVGLQETSKKKDGVRSFLDDGVSSIPGTTEAALPGATADKHARYVYKVAPFEGKLKSGQYVDEASRQLADLINQQSRDGWEFDSVNSVHIRVNPGCLAGVFGADVSYVTHDQVVFRKER